MSEKTKRDRGSPPPAARPAAASGSPMDVGLLEQLVKLMAENDLNTVDVRDGDKRVVLKRGAEAPAIAYAMPAGQPAFAAAPPAQAAAAAGAGAAKPADESAGHLAIKAEMVGTFYSSAKPGEAPFVNVGSTVDEETTVCVIEAMKNFFPVKAGVRGSIAKVLVQNGQTVQFDQALFLVKPS